MRFRQTRSTRSGGRPGRKRLARPARVALCALLLAGTAAGPLASRPVVGKIRGTVSDSSNNPLSGLMVQLSSKDDNGVLRVTGTDERGGYLFRDLPAGIYEIVVGATGYERARKIGIEVRPPFQNIVGFVLKRAVGEGGDVGLPGAGVRRGAGNSAGREAPPGLVSTIEPGAVTMPVRGLFVDKDRQGIPEVSVTFIGLEGGGAYQGVSGEDGAFLLEAVPVGRYRVLVSSPGHVALDLPSVEVAGPGGLNLSLSLVDFPLNSRERMGVVVLPDEKARPLPTAYSFPEEPERKPERVKAAASEDTPAEQEETPAQQEEAPQEQSADGEPGPVDSTGSGEGAGSD